MLCESPSCCSSSTACLFVIACYPYLSHLLTPPTQDSANPQPIYLDTQDGPLSYILHESASTIPDGADFADLVHLGYGTAVYTNVTGYISSPPGTFNWIGNLNEYWLACPRPGPGYRVLKSVSTAIDNLGCTTVQLAALDYSGKSPAAGAYI
jgi:hypothetical protein